MPHIERFAGADARQALEHRLRRIGGSGKNFQHLELAVGEIDAIGKCAAGIDGYAQIAFLRFEHMCSTLTKLRSSPGFKTNLGHHRAIGRSYNTRAGASLNPIYGWLAEASREQKRTLLAAFLGYMLDSMDVMLYALVLGQVQREMHLSAALSGAMMSATLIAAAFGGVGFGWFADRYGRVRALTVQRTGLFRRHRAVRLCADSRRS